MSPSIGLQIFIGLPFIALIFRILEHCRPLARQPLFRTGWLADVVYYVVGIFLGQFSGAASLAAMLFLRHASGLDLGHLAAGQPVWLQVLEILLFSDLQGYLFHRLLHGNAWLWRFHKVHHSSRHMDWLAAARLHPIDKLMGDLVQFIPLLCLGFGDGPLLIYASILGFQMFFLHSNIRINLGPLRWIIAGPDFHQWHHCEDPRAYNKNFSPHLVIFDRLFGTAHMPADRARPWKYGVRENTPDGFWQQLVQPFRENWTAVRRLCAAPRTDVRHWHGDGTKVQLSGLEPSYEMRAALLFAVLTRRHLAM